MKGESVMNKYPKGSFKENNLERDYNSNPPKATKKAAKEWIETHFDNNGYGNPIYGRKEK